MSKIEKICTITNQAIPSVYGESLSYTQQVAFLTYKINECINRINSMGLGSLPSITQEMEGDVLVVSNGAPAWSTQLKNLSGDVLTMKGEVAFLNNQFSTIIDGLVELISVQTEIINGGV